MDESITEVSNSDNKSYKLRRAYEEKYRRDKENRKEMLRTIQAICEKQMEILYPKNMPYLVKERYREELEIARDLKNLDEFCAFGVLGRHSLKGKYTMLPSGVTSGSYLLYLMNPDGPNPLQAHYYCQHCGFFALGPKNVFGADLPVKNCPDCGAMILADGFDLDIDYIFGPNRNRHPRIEFMSKETFISSENYWERYGQLHNHRETCLSYAGECALEQNCGYRYREEIYHELIGDYGMEKQKAYDLMEIIRSCKLHHMDNVEEVCETYGLTAEQLAPYKKVAYVSSLANAIVRVLPAMRNSEQSIINAGN